MPAFGGGIAVAEAYVPAGRYYVGERFGKADYKALANRTVGAFFIMKTEVTYDVYGTVRDWAVTKGYVLDEPCSDCGADDGSLPVSAITWVGATVWANALSEMQGLDPAYRDASGRIIRSVEKREALETRPPAADATGYRLPTLVEWHIAARGAKKGMEDGSYGARHAGGDDIDAVAWHEGRSQETGPAPVARLRPNAIGVHDLSGNVAEWTGTVFDMGEGPRSRRTNYYYCGESWARSRDMTLASCDMHSSRFSEGSIRVSYAPLPSVD